jgi:predicted N-acetyltransferase YhbS
MTPRQVLLGTPQFLFGFGANLPVALKTLSVIEKAHPKEPHYYLAILGTRPDRQSRGTGSALMRPVLEKCDADGIPAYLESSKEQNIAFYARFGFEVTGEIQLPNGPTLWPMWRNPGRTAWSSE